MKKIIILAHLLILQVVICQSQKAGHQFLDPAKSDFYQMMENRINNNITSHTNLLPYNINASPDEASYPEDYPDSLYVFNINFHVFRNSNGVRTTGNINEAEIMNAIKDINVNLNQFKIFFKYRGFRYIDNDVLVGSKMLNELTALTQNPLPPDYPNGLGLPNTFNFFITDGEISLGPGAGTTPAVTPFGGDTSWLSYSGFTNQHVLLYAVGSCLYLMPDYRGYNSSGCEHVTRDQYDPATGSINPYYNANVAGDRIHDTPANKPEGAWIDNNFTTNCRYIGEDSDCSTMIGTVANTTNHYSDVTSVPNFMQYGYSTCDYIFTVGQGRRMRWAIGIGGYNTYKTTVASLYEPFEYQHIGGNTIIKLTDNYNGTAEVCRNLLFKYRFQKGFNYEFLEPFNPIVTNAFGINEIPLLTDKTFDFRIKILEVSTTNAITIPISCTRGMVCGTEVFVSGHRFSATNLAVPVVNVEQLNEIELKDPDFESTLAPQEYHIINKETESGAVLQKTIYKP